MIHSSMKYKWYSNKTGGRYYKYNIHYKIKDQNNFSLTLSYLSLD